jgi:ABC-type transport system substrate-binding protein
MQGIFEVSVTPATVNPNIASDITSPSIIISSQIVSPGSTVSLTASTLQPPTATNWTIGYYIWNFGNGIMHTDYAVLNTSSGTYLVDNVSQQYSTAGIYAATVGVITFNATKYVPSTYTSNSINYTYYPISELTSILSSGQYYNTTYISTIVVNSNAQLLKSTVLATNPNEIIVTEVLPGGAYSFDPAIDYEVIGMEIIVNIYETLVQYNGSSDSQMIPLVASEVPTVANGGISANYLNYTFNIRNGLKFSNGDPLTAWDVYTSMIRTLLFVADSPGTAGWILAQDLLPGDGFATNATSYQNVTQAITVDNTTQTVTFHLLKPDPAFLDYIADPEGAAIVDYSWLVAHGAGITFSPPGFVAYTNEGNEVDYNTYVQYNAMGSGPYMIKTFLIGQSIVLAPNPDYTPIAGIPGYNHTANDTIYIQWEKDAATALLIAESGQTDIVTRLPNYDYPIMAKLQSEGKIKVVSFTTLSINFFNYNFNINTTMLPTLGPQYNIPQYYFTNLDVRRAFAYAFDYTNYIDNIVGDDKYGADFAFHYTGIIPLGMPGYMNVTQLLQADANVPTYNLTIAKQYMEESGLYNTSINIPIVVEAGDLIDYAASQAWATTLNSIDPNIHVSALYMEVMEMIGYMVPNQDPMPIFMLGWNPDYPFPSDYIIPMYGENGTYGAADCWTPQILAANGQQNQSQEDALMNTYIADAQNTGNATLAIKYYDQAEILGVNLTFYTYSDQLNGFWFYSPVLKGVQYELNAVYSGSWDTLFIYLSK